MLARRKETRRGSDDEQRRTCSRCVSAQAPARPSSCVQGRNARRSQIRPRPLTIGVTAAAIRLPDDDTVTQCRNGSPDDASDAKVIRGPSTSGWLETSRARRESHQRVARFCRTAPKSRSLGLRTPLFVIYSGVGGPRGPGAAPRLASYSMVGWQLEGWCGWRSRHNVHGHREQLDTRVQIRIAICGCLTIYIT